MATEIRCDQCQALLRIPDTAAGKKVRCPRCAAVVDVPVSDSESAPKKAIPPPKRQIPSEESRRHATTQPAPRRPVDSNIVASPFSSPLLHWSLAGCTVIIVAAVFFGVGRLVPMFGAAKGSASITAASPDVSSRSSAADAPQKPLSTTLIAESSIAIELEQIQKLEAEYRLGEDFENDSQPDNGQRIKVPDVPREELGEIDGFTSSGNPKSDFDFLKRTQYFLQMEERRGMRYRAAAILSKASEDKSRRRAAFRILAIAPELNQECTNAAWVFRHLDYSDSLVTETGATIPHPDAAKVDQTAAAIVGGTAGPEAILDSLRSMRYPIARAALFETVGSAVNLQETQRRMCLSLLATPVIQGLMFDMQVGPGSFMSKQHERDALKTFATATSTPESSDLVVDVIRIRLQVDPLMKRKLEAQVFGHPIETGDDRRSKSWEALSESENETLNTVWKNASTEAILRLLVSLDGTNRSVQLRRLFRERQLTEVQSGSLISPDTASEELDVLLGHVPAMKLIEVAMSLDQSFDVQRALDSMAESSGLTQLDANEIANACRRLSDRHDASGILKKLDGKADIEHLTIGFALCGDAAELRRCAKMLADPDEKKRILDLAANEAHKGLPDDDTLEFLAPYGSVANLLTAWDKIRSQSPFSSFLKGLAARPDLTATERNRIQEYQNRK